MTQRNVQRLMIAILLACVLLGALLFYENRRTHNALLKKLPKPVTINVKNQPTIGNPRSTVHIVAFEDLKCANCKRYSTQVFPSIKKEFVDSGKAQYTLINLAFLPGSTVAATAARCLYDQKDEYFFKFVHYVYHHQGQENQNWINIPTMLSYANKIQGIDASKLESCLIASPYVTLLQNNLKIASNIMKGEVATPSVYINGVLVVPLTLAHFKAVYNSVAQS